MKILGIGTDIVNIKRMDNSLKKYGLLFKNRIFLTLWASTFVGSIGMGLVSAILPVFARELGATGIWLGLVFASFKAWVIALAAGRIASGKPSEVWASCVADLSARFG